MSVCVGVEQEFMFHTHTHTDMIEKYPQMKLIRKKEGKKGVIDSRVNCTERETEKDR